MKKLFAKWSVDPEQNLFDIPEEVREKLIRDNLLALDQMIIEDEKIRQELIQKL